MERLEMFVQALLVLLTAIHVTAACICSMLTWEAAMCPANNKTVVLARLLSSSGELYDEEGRYVSVASSAIQGRYQMELNTIFKNGSIPLLVLDNKITMVFPVKEVNCGHHFTQDTDFVIGGVVLFGGILSSSMCQLLVPYEDVANVRRITQILQDIANFISTYKRSYDSHQIINQKKTKCCDIYGKECGNYRARDRCHIISKCSVAAHNVCKLHLRICPHTAKK